jgi:hypothetical protein
MVTKKIRRPGIKTEKNNKKSSPGSDLSFHFLL